jgi:hypothetical protein
MIASKINYLSYAMIISAALTWVNPLEGANRQFGIDIKIPLLLA